MVSWEVAIDMPEILTRHCRSSGNFIRITARKKKAPTRMRRQRGSVVIGRFHANLQTRAASVASQKEKKQRPGGVPGRRLGVPTRTREGFAWPPILGELSFAVLTHGPGSVGSVFQRKIRPGLDGKFHRISLGNRRCLFAAFYISADTKAPGEPPLQADATMRQRPTERALALQRSKDQARGSLTEVQD